MRPEPVLDEDDRPFQTSVGPSGHRAVRREAAVMTIVGLVHKLYPFPKIQTLLRSRGNVPWERGRPALDFFCSEGGTPSLPKGGHGMPCPYT
jgi:hypothetical protein